MDDKELVVLISIMGAWLYANQRSLTTQQAARDAAEIVKYSQAEVKKNGRT